MICQKHIHVKAPYPCAICLIEERDELAHLVNSLANIIIDSSFTSAAVPPTPVFDGVSSNDLDVANDAIERVVPLLKGE